ncbi:MAG: hypothetical protein Q7S46_04295 [Gallionella sp.]|nr:hypothetical protein [Gallionella sp.]
MKAGCITHIVAGIFILLPLLLGVKNPLTRILNKFGIKDGAC